MNEIPIGAIRPNPGQPRKQFHEKALAELSNSLKRHGMIQPIVVRPREGFYEIVAGERRYQAAKQAGFSRVPVLIIEANETRVMELALIENIQRADLSAIEEAMAYAEMLKEFNVTQAELANRVGKSRSHITNSLRLLQLPVDVQQAVMEERLSMGHARALLALKNPLKIERMAERVMRENWTVRRLEQELREKKQARPVAVKPTELDFIEEALRDRIGATVRIKTTKQAGKLEIDFIDEDDLNRILELLLPEEHE
ncbi:MULTISPECIES: ParB/RepB/Spo0J family partition protein [Exiguobacterium]|jgi:ParB family chromosome partitioning protein|uniref:Chromosome partitioning protein ParB n=1 Tax=Exiguobacterium undae TaxID=169177 RepID=A0ABX2V706_9BACL|nr:MULTISPECIES: ParB/RepB/Spo0J family partition protein [Exiguobacterium]OAN12703.1 chromosome partitioning protein ParB [Exiguobacterium undae]